MTSEIEKQFFEAFGIPKKLDCKRCGASNVALGLCAEVRCEADYPPITDRILLGLICNATGLCVMPNCTTEQIKNAVLRILINQSAIRTDLKPQVQALFKENN